MDYYNGRRFDGRRSPYGYPPQRYPMPGKDCGCERQETERKQRPEPPCRTETEVLTAGNTFPSAHFPVGMAYVPTQGWGETFDLCKAFQAGTIFPILEKPFTGRCPKR